MTGLQILGAAANAFFVISIVVVGVRLVMLSRRTGGLPEFLIGFAFATIGLAGFPLMLASRLGMGTVSEVDVPVLALALAVLGLSLAALFGFTWRVFRADSKAAAVFVLLAVLGVAGISVSTIHVITTSPAEMNSLEALGAWTSALRIPFGVWYGWTAHESLRCWGLGRRRQALGLSDPVVVNRFFLWGTMGVLESVANLGAFVLELQGLNPFQSTAGALTMAANGIIAVVLMVLTFMPPPAYLRWVKGRAEGAAGAAGT